MAIATAEMPMLSHPWAGAATPTTMGKEIALFVDRLRHARRQIAAVPLRAKMNGAVGTKRASVSLSRG